MYEIVINIIAGEAPFSGAVMQGETIISLHSIPTTGIYTFTVDSPGEYQVIITDDWGCRVDLENIIIISTTTSTSTTTEEITTTTTTQEVITTTTTTTTIEPYEICPIYGNLYNFYAVDDERGLVADGYHVPTLSEYQTLFSYLTDNGYGYEGSGDDVAKSMASKEYWTEHTPNPPVTYAGSPGHVPSTNNSSGLNIKPGGFRTNLFTNINYDCYLWTATETNSANAVMLEQFYGYNKMFDSSTYKQWGHSVRAIADSTTLSHGETGTYIGNDGKIYPTICIGSQEWVSEHLCETMYRNNDLIEVVESQDDWGNMTTGAMCYYENDIDNSHYEGICTTTTTTDQPTTTTTTTTP